MVSGKGTVIFHPRYMDHYQSTHHPESPERLQAILDGFQELGYSYSSMDSEIEPACQREMLRCHTEEYLDYLSGLEETQLDPDTAFHNDTYEIAKVAAGGALKAAEMAFRGNFAMALLRPPGHHATADRAMGFCYLNNAAIAAASQAARGRKVAVVDLDVHHGNGTNDIFHASPEVLYISVHQWGIYPGTGFFTDVGTDDGRGYTVNIPFPASAGDASLELAMTRVILPAITAFQPDLLIISLGLDGHKYDPLAGLTYSTRGYITAVRQLTERSKEISGRPPAVLLEGGYDLDALRECVPWTYHHIAGGQTLPRFPSGDSPDRGNDGPRAAESVKGVLEVQRKVGVLLSP